MSPEIEDANLEAFNKWKAIAKGNASRYVGFVDGDPVVWENKYWEIVLLTEHFKSLRGEKSTTGVYDCNV